MFQYSDHGTGFPNTEKQQQATPGFPSKTNHSGISEGPKALCYGLLRIPERRQQTGRPPPQFSSEMVYHITAWACSQIHHTPTENPTAGL